MHTKYPSSYNFKKIKKEFKSYRKFETSSNKYNLKYKHNKHMFEAIDNKFISKIEGSNLIILKNNEGLYAIGDENNKPLTEYMFLHIAHEVNDNLVEVITKEGDTKHFNIANLTVEECIGVATLGAGATAGSGGSTNSNSSSSSSSTTNNTNNFKTSGIQYSDVKDELLLPIKGKTPLLYGAAKGGNKRRRGKYY